MNEQKSLDPLQHLTFWLLAGFIRFTSPFNTTQWRLGPSLLSTIITFGWFPWLRHSPIFDVGILAAWSTILTLHIFKDAGPGINLLLEQIDSPTLGVQALEFLLAQVRSEHTPCWGCNL